MIPRSPLKILSSCGPPSLVELNITFWNNAILFHAHLDVVDILIFLNDFHLMSKIPKKSNRKCLSIAFPDREKSLE